MRCAIVGSGLAALAGYATLRHGGVAAEDIVILGTHADPIVVWRERAESIRQQRMRSESDGHLAAAERPGRVVVGSVNRDLVRLELTAQRLIRREPGQAGSDHGDAHYFTEPASSPWTK